MIGRYDILWNQNDQRERCWWIGKPWRRVELLMQDVFWRGERVDRTTTSSLTIGFRRLGWHLHISLTRAVGMDYSDEEQSS